MAGILQVIRGLQVLTVIVCIALSIAAYILAVDSSNNHVYYSSTSNITGIFKPGPDSKLSPLHPRADHSAKLPFPNAVPLTIIKPSGTKSTVYIASYYTPPSHPPESARHTKWIPAKSPMSLCSVSTFVVETTPCTPHHASPAVDDCLALHQWALSNPGHWIVAKHDLVHNDWTPLLALDSCAFGVTVRKEWRGDIPWGVAVASADVAEVMWEAVGKGQIEGRVLAGGDMACLGWGRWEPGVAPVDWRIMSWDEKERYEKLESLEEWLSKRCK